MSELSKVLFPNKSTGDTFSAAEANELKNKINSAIDLLNNPVSAGGGNSGSNIDTTDNRVDLNTTSGDGSDGNGLTSSDGTGGFQAAINALTRSGRIRVLAFEYNITKPVVIAKHALVISGDAASFNEDPNGESIGHNGLLLKLGNNVAFNLGVANERRGGIILEKLYIWGNGYANNIPALNVVSGLDQPRFRDLNISNVYAAIKVDGGIDTGYFNNFNVLNAGYGYLGTSNYGSHYNHFVGGCWADLEYSAVMMTTQFYNSFTFDDMTITRCARVNNTALRRNANMYLMGKSHRVSNCLITEAGRNYLTNGQNTNCDGLVLDSMDTVVTNCTFAGNVTGAAIRVKGNRNTISNNTFSGNQLGAQYFEPAYTATAKAFSSNLYDIYVESTAADTVINQAGFCNIIDNGARTIINGLSSNSGDPDTVGVWHFVIVKPEGLLIQDTVNGIIYEYRSSYQGGRRVVATGVTASAGGTGGTGAGGTSSGDPALSTATTAPSSYQGLIAPSTGTLRVEQNAAFVEPYIRYKGDSAWAETDQAAQGFSGTTFYNLGANAYVEIRGFMRRVRFGYTQAPSCGTVTMSVDGKVITTFAQTGPEAKQTIFDSGLYAAGEHIFRFKVDNVMTVDFFDIANS